MKVNATFTQNGKIKFIKWVESVATRDTLIWGLDFLESECLYIMLERRNSNESLCFELGIHYTCNKRPEIFHAEESDLEFEDDESPSNDQDELDNINHQLKRIQEVKDFSQAVSGNDSYYQMWANAYYKQDQQ